MNSNNTYLIAENRANVKSRNISYLIIDKSSKFAAIIDPAWQLDSFIKIIDENNLTLSTILLTHSHYDHTNLADCLVEKYNVRVYMSLKEIEFYNFKCNNLYELHDGDLIKIGNTAISCMLTPGHTAGGMCYLLNDCIFTGDTIFIEGCGICNAYGGCPRLMYESIQRIKKEAPYNSKIYPGHLYGKEPGYQLSYLLKNNIYFKIHSIDAFIKYRMRSNQQNHLDLID